MLIKLILYLILYNYIDVNLVNNNSKVKDETNLGKGPIRIGDKRPVETKSKDGECNC